MKMETRTEYPRPQFRREQWQPLNGEWEFEFDDAVDGVQRGLCSGKVGLNKKILVPFSYQYVASGIGDTSVHEVVWYRRTFEIAPCGMGKRALLCFNGSDYKTDVWVNGNHICEHTGGYAPFSADITSALQEGENTLVVRCYDPQEPAIPRGKQSWTGSPFACWYVANTGIWQSVWIEFFDYDYIQSYTLEADIDSCSFGGELQTQYGKANKLTITVSYEGKQIKKQRMSFKGNYMRYAVSLMESDYVDESQFWSPEHPNLFYVDFELYCDGKLADRAHTRFGMRKIAVDEYGNICLNHKKLYQRLVLDQGYWKDSGLTPPTKESLKEDIQSAIAMGFNGARKHQKFEDPYYYYYAEELGFLVWCEMPSAYNFTPAEITAQTAQWQQIVGVARNFTSVVCYVPLNESWGVRKILTDKKQQNYARSLYYTTKALDATRLVSTNDGWENLDASDIVSIHDYAYDSAEFTKKYQLDKLDSLYPHLRKLMAEGNKYAGQPVLFTEFGGIALQNDGGWGYNSQAQSAEEYFARLQNLMKGIAECDFQGYCFTQLTDVQQEVNGLLDENHMPKLDAERLKLLFTFQEV
jgi:hypothetical protein